MIPMLYSCTASVVSVDIADNSSRHTNIQSASVYGVFWQIGKTLRCRGQSKADGEVLCLTR